MNFRSLQHSQLLAAVIFLTAVLVLAVQLITPSPVVVSLGPDGTQTTSVGEYFSYVDVLTAVVCAFFAGVSGTSLLSHQGSNAGTSTKATASADVPGGRQTTNGGVNRAPGRNASTESATSPDEDTWRQRLERLTDNEETIYELLIDADGELAQRKLVDETDLSKATVSRTLDNLEHRGWVARHRNGMGNTIRLK